ncbi:MAG TPA: hypothetical protein PLG89_12905, partial [Arenimonas sp.]|nr:hypothetical protein [Arenimonas sp.]
FQQEGEGTEPCLARIYPDFEALSADGRFEALAHGVCGPLADWATLQVRVQAHPGGGADTSAPAPATEASA